MHAGSSGLYGQLSAEPGVASTGDSETGQADRVGGWVWSRRSFIRYSNEHREG